MMAQSVSFRAPFLIDETVADSDLPDIVEVGGDLKLGPIFGGKGESS